MPHQLPLARAFGDGDIQIRRGHVRDCLDYQRQERHEIDDQQKGDLLGFRRAEPGDAQRYENDRGNVRADQRDGAKERRDRRKRRHIDTQRNRHHHCEREAEADSLDGSEGVAHQRLVEMQRRKRFQHLQRAGQDRHVDQPVLEPLPAREEPPRQQHKRRKNAGEQELIALRNVLAHTQPRQAHEGGEQPDEQRRKEKETEHGYEMEYGSSGAMECLENGVMKWAIAGRVGMTPTLQHSITPLFRSSITPSILSPTGTP